MSLTSALRESRPGRLGFEVRMNFTERFRVQLLLSRDSDKDWARAIAMMRHGFSGHAYGVSKAAYGVSKAAPAERERGRVHEISPELPRLEARLSP
jgi:hypothetical protein